MKRERVLEDFSQSEASSDSVAIDERWNVNVKHTVLPSDCELCFFETGRHALTGACVSW